MTTMFHQSLDTPATHRFTRQQYEQMAEQGYFDDRRVQLIDGEVIDMPVQKHAHYLAISIITRRIEGIFGAHHWVRAQAPLLLDDDSMPEPDVGVAPRPIEQTHAHPSTAILVIEVSDTTLLMDRKPKAALYSRANIADYWILNLIDRQLEVHRNPTSDGYQSITFCKPTDTISPLALPSATIIVADLLP